MNKARLRVDMSNANNESAVIHIEWMQRDSEIMRLFLHLDGSDKIRWKDSIKAVVAGR